MSGFLTRGEVRFHVNRLAPVLRGRTEQQRRNAVKNYEIVEVGPAEKLILGGGPVVELDAPINTNFERPDASIADVD